MAGRFETAIEWAERAIHRMRRWYSAHIVLAASHVALERQENAVEAVKTCRNALPEICIKDLDRAPLRDHDKLNELRARLFKAGFA